MYRGWRSGRIWAPASPGTPSSNASARRCPRSSPATAAKRATLPPRPANQWSPLVTVPVTPTGARRKRAEPPVPAPTPSRTPPTRALITALAHACRAGSVSLLLGGTALAWLISVWLSPAASSTTTAVASAPQPVAQVSPLPTATHPTTVLAGPAPGPSGGSGGGSGGGPAPKPAAAKSSSDNGSNSGGSSAPKPAAPSNSPARAARVARARTATRRRNRRSPRPARHRHRAARDRLERSQRLRPAPRPTPPPHHRAPEPPSRPSRPPTPTRHRRRGGDRGTQASHPGRQWGHHAAGRMWLGGQPA